MGYKNHMGWTRTSLAYPVIHTCLAAVSVAVFLLPLRSVRGQESVRMSIASAEAAEARRKAQSSIGYYNIKLGPPGWKFGSGLGLEYNDNVENRSENREGDFILRPQINAEMIWPLSEKNSLNLSLGGGYSFYVEHSSLDRLFITPG